MCGGRRAEEHVQPSEPKDSEDGFSAGVGNEENA